MPKNTEKYVHSLVKIEKTIKKQIIKIANRRNENDEPNRHFYEVANEMMLIGLEKFQKETQN